MNEDSTVPWSDEELRTKVGQVCLIPQSVFSKPSLILSFRLEFKGVLVCSFWPVVVLGTPVVGVSRRAPSLEILCLLFEPEQPFHGGKIELPAY